MFKCTTYQLDMSDLLTYPPNKLYINFNSWLCYWTIQILNYQYNLFQSLWSLCYSNIKIFCGNGNKTWFLCCSIFDGSDDYGVVLRDQHSGTRFSDCTNISIAGWRWVCFACFWDGLVLFYVGFFCGIYDAVKLVEGHLGLKFVTCLGVIMFCLVG